MNIHVTEFLATVFVFVIIALIIRDYVENFLQRDEENRISDLSVVVIACISVFAGVWLVSALGLI